VSSELVTSVVALVISAGAAVVAGLSYRRAGRFRDEAYFAEVAAFRAAIRRKTVLQAAETARWDAPGVHDSVRELRDDLADRIGNLPKEMVPSGEAAVEACTRLLGELRPWALDSSKVGVDIHEIPDALAAVERWVTAIRGELARLDAFSKP
jgi:hypothetical protein